MTSQTVPATSQGGPRTPAETTLYLYLHSVSAMIAANHPDRVARMKYPSYEALILGEGRLWTPARLPRRAHQGYMRYCYLNALNLSATWPELRYVEGYAVPVIAGETFIPVQHAWCVDRFDRVWDNTWPEPQASAYYGMVFTREEVARFIEMDEETFGILPTEYRIGNPLLSHGKLFPGGADHA
jgi:hypothetical protein